MKTISFTNQKGGAGKTTSAANVAIGYASMGRRVLMVDMDPQGSLTKSCFGINTDGITTMKEVLTGEDPIEDAILTHEIIEGISFDIIPADTALAPVEYQLAMNIGSTKLLRKSLARIADRYDYCIIDCPPSLGHLLIQALTASDYAIINANPSKPTIEAIDILYTTIEAVWENTNPDLKIIGILLNRYSDRVIVHRKWLAETEMRAEKYGTKVFKTKIRSSVSVEEANDDEIPLILNDMNSKPAQDYIKFMKELLAEGY